MAAASQTFCVSSHELYFKSLGSNFIKPSEAIFNLELCIYSSIYIGTYGYNLIENWLVQAYKVPKKTCL